MRVLFVMDPYQSMLPDKDTSLALMRAADARGHRCYHCLPHNVSNLGRVVWARVQELTPTPDGSPAATAKDPERVELADFDAIVIRKDPPFDDNYLHLTQQLDLVPDGTFIMNRPQALRDANEKLFAFQFAEFMPETFVSSDTEDILAFVRDVGGHAVIKPLDGAGGAGVMGVHAADRHARGIVDYVTRESRQLAMAQCFQPDVVQGDKRVLLLDGKLLGAIRRVPRPDDIRANIHVGGRVEATELTPNEMELVEAVAPKLSEAGLYFVGLDLISEKLIEVNVTSPTGIQELARLTATEPAVQLIQWLEDRCA